MNFRLNLGLRVTSRAVLIAITVAGGVIATVPAHAAPSGPRPTTTTIRPAAGKAASTTPPPNSKPCFYQFPDCTSSDPHVEFGIGSQGDTSACTFQTTVDWNDKTPNTTQTYSGGADGSSLATFDHAYADPGTYNLTVSNQTTSGSCSNFGTVTWQFTLTNCPGKELSGPSWVSKFPPSTAVSDLSGTFRSDVTRFIAAMRKAGIKVTIIQTLRPPERAYLIHFSWLIAKKQIKPLDVPDFVPGPGQQSVNICWVHTKAGGEDLAASIAAAKQMISGYKPDPTLKVAPALSTLHSRGLAIDMTTTWTKDSIKIVNGAGDTVTIDTDPHTGLNRKLESVGKTYGVIHLINAAKDKNHWSYNGH